MTFSGITKNQQQPVAPQVVEDEQEEVDDGLPLWKKALMKKRAEEEKKKYQEFKQKVAKTRILAFLFWSSKAVL